VQNKPIYLFILFAAAAFLFISTASARENEQVTGIKFADQSNINAEHWNTVDHSKFDALKKKFTAGHDITKACLSCHTEVKKQFMHAIHWTWLSPTGGGLTGKAGYSINNFCISTNKMHDTECNNCHIGWDKKNDGINCLKCHGQSQMDWHQEFKDLKEFQDTGETELVDEIESDIQKNVLKIGLPQRRNCGECHFNGGGGEGVKHGDLDASLIMPKKSLDVHMGIDGANFTCTRCHTTKNHLIAGRVYSTPATSARISLVQDDLAPKISCESCHTDQPHAQGSKPNDHTDRVACQTCHIPTFARAHATQMWWDWSSAGKLKKQRKYQQKDEYHRYSYKSIKGDFKWEKNVVPEYYWYNGSIKALTAKDIIDPSKQPVAMSWPVGSRDDKNARIFPFKVHRGKQPYDMENNTFLTPLLCIENNGYWKTLDWIDSCKRGMQIMGLPFSGKIGFVETSYVFPTTHMVAPRENALTCVQCHNRTHSRLAALTGFYMPGRDRSDLLDFSGWGIALAALAGILLHMLGRIFITAKKEED